MAIIPLVADFSKISNISQTTVEDRAMDLKGTQIEEMQVNSSPNSVHTPSKCL